MGTTLIESLSTNIKDFHDFRIILQYRKEEAPFLKSIGNEHSFDVKFVGKFEENLG